MLKRVITALVALCVLVPVMFLSDTWVLPIAVAICCFIATYEMLKCIGCLSNGWLSVPLLVISFASPVLVRIIDSLETYYIVLACTVFFEMLYLMAVMVFSKGNTGPEKISMSAFMTFYIVLGFSSIVLLHDYFATGKYVYLLIFVGAWITDIFAYFCGRLFGKHKLIPEVSPKKTVEGSIGGTLFSGIAFVLFSIIAEYFDIFIKQSHLTLFLFGLIAAIVAQIGDLCMSALKRKFEIKDFGNVFPGHGGMLDRFDSIIAVAIVLLILNTVVVNL